MKNRYLLIAGLLCLITALIHLVGGQVSLIDPMLSSDMIYQVKGELVGAWHMVTIILFYSAFVLLRPFNIDKEELLKFLGIVFVLFGVIFVITSLHFELLTPQFILLTPIGVLILLALSKLKSKAHGRIDR